MQVYFKSELYVEYSNRNIVSVVSRMVHKMVLKKI